MRHLFYELILVALARRKALSYSPSFAEWEQLYRMAEEHALQGITFAAVCLLPEEQLPPSELVGQWYYYSALIEQKNKEMNVAIKDVAALLNQHHIAYAVVKGQVCALAYSHVEHELSQLRSPGDVDFYVTSHDYARAKQLIQSELQVTILADDATDKHDAFIYRNQHFEMHFRLETFGTKKHQTAFDCLMEDAATDGRAEWIDVDGVPVRVLPKEEHILMVFKHLFNHLLVEGVGIRQFLDLMMLLEDGESRLNYGKLQLQLRAIGYEKAFHAVCALLLNYLGMKATACPYEIQSDDCLWAKQLIQVPMSRGNFGQHHRKHTQPGWRRSLETMRIAMQHCLRFWPLAKADIAGLLLVRPFITLKKYCNA